MYILKKEVEDMSKINVMIRMNKDTKEQAEELFEDLGMGLTKAINLFVRQSLREQAVPFRITRNFPGEETSGDSQDAEQQENGCAMTVSAIIKTILEDKNLTLVDLSRMLDIKYPAAIGSSLSRNMKVGTLLKYLTALDCELVVRDLKTKTEYIAKEGIQEPQET